MNYATYSVEQLLADGRRARGDGGDAGDGDDFAFPAFVRDRPQLARLSITHDAVMDWLLTNPGKGQMGRCAAHFGFTQAWLSSMVWSDAFQAKLRDRKEQLFAETVIPIRDQMNGVAQRALDRIGEEIEDCQDIRKLTDVADKMLHRLGYAPKVDVNPNTGTTVNQQNNFYAVDATLLAQARENSKKGVQAIEHTSEKTLGIPSPSGIQGSEECYVGETFNQPTALCSASPQGAEEGREIPGDQV